MRFRIGPDVWPEIKILEKMNTSDDIRTDACEVDLELFVGQEQEINIDFSGAIWTWRALTQTIYCREYEMPLKQKNGRIMLHFFSDTVIQELFANGERGMMIVLPDGRGVDGECGGVFGVAERGVRGGFLADASGCGGEVG